MAAFATVEDYEARARVTLTGAARAQVQALLDDVSELMRSHLPPGFAPAAGAARAVAVGVVRRVMANPGGYRQRSTGSYSETLGEDGGMALTDAEIAMLLGPDQTSGADRAFTLLPRDDGMAQAYAHHHHHHGRRL